MVGLCEAMQITFQKCVSPLVHFIVPDFRMSTWNFSVTIIWIVCLLMRAGVPKSFFYFQTLIYEQNVLPAHVQYTGILFSFQLFVHCFLTLQTSSNSMDVVARYILFDDKHRQCLWWQEMLNCWSEYCLMLWELDFSSNSQLSGVSHLDVPGLKSGGPLLLTPPGLSLKFESG